MSTYEDGDIKAPRKGEHEYLSPEEDAFIKRLLSRPESIPPEFWRAMLQKVALDGEPIPYTQVQGLSRFAFGSGAELPATPSEGQFFSLSVADGVVWSFRYNSQSSSLYKWEFVGGPPLVHSVSTEESTSSATAADLSTDGPTLTMPFKGEYLATMMSHGRVTGSGAEVFALLFANGSEVSSASQQMSDSQGGGELPRSHFATLTSAGQVIKMRYKTTAGTAHYKFRLLFVTPVRIG